MSLSNRIILPKDCQYELFKNNIKCMCGDLAVSKYKRKYFCQEHTEYLTGYGFKNEIVLLKNVS